MAKDTSTEKKPAQTEPPIVKPPAQSATPVRDGYICTTIVKTSKYGELPFKGELTHEAAIKKYNDYCSVKPEENLTYSVTPGEAVATTPYPVKKSK